MKEGFPWVCDIEREAQVGASPTSFKNPHGLESLELIQIWRVLFLTHKSYENFKLEIFSFFLTSDLIG